MIIVVLSLILVVLSALMALDWYTSFFGILGFIGIQNFNSDSLHNINDILFLLLALIISIFIIILSFFSIDILEIKGSFMENLNSFFLKPVLKIITVLAILYDAVTSYLGIARFFIKNKFPNDIFPVIDFQIIFKKLTFYDQLIICLPFTIFLVLSPILFYNIITSTLKSQQE